MVTATGGFEALSELLQTTFTTISAPAVMLISAIVGGLGVEDTILPLMQAGEAASLYDEHIKGIANSGGVVGLCISPRFLRGSGDDSTISDMIRHLDYLYNCGGEDVLTIGTDFDGTSGQFEIASPLDMPKLFERLDAHKWPPKRIEKLAYLNASRILTK